MEILVLIILGIVIICRIIIIIQKIFQLLVSGYFWIGVILNIVLFNGVKVLYEKLYDESIYDILNGSGSSLIFLSCVIIAWIVLLYYVKILRMPFYLLLLILSLGLIIYNIDNRLDLSGDDNTFVDPHQVDGYYKKDGSYVNGYWRDGDGNTSVNLTKSEGGGYWRSK